MKKAPIIQGKEVQNLIPQRSPIVMVDAFYGIENNCSHSGLTITADNIFCQEGKLQEAGIIEHIAQSAAARIGYIYRQKNEPVPLGFIGSVDKLTIHRLPKIGQELSTEITVIQEVFDITLVAACVNTKEGMVAECRMKIFLEKR
ncbi:hydroxymyristoyl-ACP dehydratase [Bacteroides sp. UBA939]|uniref:hydroxymyristoyl-ACP dehydratase n=1 Tax=Bacteroides sp. UBA939 TaxID=1946092 RepID=UPI0025C71B07|nr:hydroxymyristoyl-ACP dehydratase [Bacteroides sp. UBA939]